MSLKFKILNVSYEEPQKCKQSDTKFRKTVNRYSDYTRRNKFNQTCNQSHFPFGNNQKYSLYQQYKNKEFIRKIKGNSIKTDQKTLQNIIIKGSQKQKQKRNVIPNFNMTDSFVFQTVHSQFKPRTPNSRRKFTASLVSSQPNCFRTLEEEKSRGMGIIGIQTSFLDKYKMKSTSEKNEQYFYEDQNDNRIKRRQILCSTKRNRSLEPKTLKNLDFKRHSSYKKQNYLSIPNDDRILCRPWSPSAEQQFQKL